MTISSLSYIAVSCHEARMTARAPRPIATMSQPNAAIPAKPSAPRNFRNLGLPA